MPAVNQSPGGCGCGGIPCSPCAIPAANLTLTWTDVSTGSLVTSSTTLAYTPQVGSTPAIWQSGLTAADGQWFYINCPGSGNLYTYWGPSFGGPFYCETNAVNLGGGPFYWLNVTDYTCSPFHLHYQLGNSVNCGLYYANGIRDVYIDA